MNPLQSPLQEALRRRVHLTLLQLDKYHKRYKYVELEGADHFYSTLFYEHQIKLYESLIGFLRDDCGPGGL